MDFKKMKRIFLYSVSIISLAFFTGHAQTNPERDKKLSELISKMTLEEKVGQMTNLTLATVAEKTDEPVKLNMDKVKDVIINHHIGSVQNVLSHAYKIEEWHQIIKTLQDVTLKETRLKIPFMYNIDAVHGCNYTIGSTLFPHNLGMAATRNQELARLCAEITAKEVRASGIRWNFSPVLDVGRQPLWPRFGETFGEDVYLVKTMGLASVQGYEGNSLKTKGVAACMKHFVGYSVPASGKDRAPAYIPEIMLREYFLPSFQAAIDGGAHTLMVNSAEVNGTPVHASKFLLTDVLRTEMGFKGLIISDWEDVKKLVDRHRVAETHKEAVRMSVNAGIDMCIVPLDYSFYDDLIALVKEEKISMQRIDESVRRILELKYELGLFDNPYPEKEAAKLFGLPEYKKAALDAARESITLLKNEKNVLPLAKGKKILLVGPNSNSLSALNGAWSYTWQGAKEDYFSKNELTIANAIRKKTGDGNVTEPDFKSTGWFSDQLAANADYIILCLGEGAYAETPGNIVDLEIPQIQKDLIRLFQKSGKPVIVILTEGRPRIIREIEPLAGAVLLAYWPGSQGGNAIADVLFGDYNPCGKLPFTYPKYSGDIVTYDHKLLDEAVEIAEPEYKFSYKSDPQWPFGFGLSYTTFEYSNLKLSADQLKGNDKLKVSVTVKNTGKLGGKETVELYSRDLYASITPSVKRLRNFKKIYLDAGTSQLVEFEISKDNLAFVNADLKWITEAGGFELMVGNLKAAFTYSYK
jgi:beta-glucosidase